MAKKRIGKSKSYYLPETLALQVKLAADERNMPDSFIVVQALKAYLRNGQAAYPPAPST